MSINQSNVANVGNYLVPAAGQTHCVKISGAPFTAQPYLVDWRQFTVDNFPFQPQGLYIDNTRASNPVSIVIMPIGYSINCPAGSLVSLPFPAPNGQSAQITSPNSTDADETDIYFVDYPVLPYFISAAQNQGADVSAIIRGINTDDALNVNVAPQASGNVPYRVMVVPNAGTLVHQSIAAGDVTIATVAPVGQSLRRLKVSISNATLATAATDSIIVAMNGVTIFEINPLIPAAADNGAMVFDFDYSAAPILAAGNLTTTIGTTLVTGIVETNALFG